MPTPPDRREAPAPVPPAAKLHLWQIQAVRDALVIFSVVGIVWAGYVMRSVTVPLLVALALAYLFEPVVSWCTRRFQASRPVVVTALICTVGVGVAAILAVTIPLVVGETVRFVKDARQGRFYQHALKLESYVPDAYRDEFRYAASFLRGPIVELPELEDEIDDPAMEPHVVEIPVEGAPDAMPIVEDIDARTRRIVREELAAREAARASGAGNSAMILGIARSSAEAAFTLLGAVVQLGLLTFLIPFYFFFFSVSYPSVVAFARDLIPRDRRVRALDLVGKMDNAVAGFVRGRLVICLIVGAVLAVGWMICGVPYAIVLGALIGAFNAVPYLSSIGFPIAIGLLALEKASGGTDMAWWGVLLWPSVVFVFAQMLDGYVLTPIIAGKATNLDPVTILVAVLAGGAVGGLYGMLLAIPAFACAKILIREVLMPRIKAWTRGEAADPLPIRNA
jgi:predicted PurR-regulated permease PerM